MTDRRLLFDSAATEYEVGRPGYPAELFDLLAERCGLATDARVLEIGAGPGQATEPMVARGANVTAVEPGVRFARRLHDRFGIPVANVFFEDVQLPDDEFELVVSATAFHWVDHEVGIPLVRRALKPGGWVALVWNRFYDADDPVEFTQATQPLMDRYLSDYKGALGRAEDAPWLDRLAEAGFVDLDEVRVPWRRIETTDEVVARFLTHSGPLSLDAARRRQLAADLRRLCDDEFGGAIQQAYVTITDLGRKPLTPER